MVKTKSLLKYPDISLYPKKKLAEILTNREYNDRKLIQSKFQKIDYDDPDKLATDMIIDFAKIIESHFNEFNENIHDTNENIHEIINNRDWKTLLSIIQGIINQIKNKKNLNKINEMIVATDKKFEGNYDIIFADAIGVINKHLKNIKIYYEIDVSKSLEYANELKKYVELISNLKDTSNTYNFTPLMSSDIKTLNDGHTYRID